MGFEVIVAFPKDLGHFLDHIFVRMFVDKILVDFFGDVLRCDLLFEDDVNNVTVVKITRTSHEGFIGFVKPIFPEHGIFAIHNPAGQCTGGFANVLLCVLINPCGEKFHEFAGIVFVGFAHSVGIAVEVIQHGRVTGNFLNQGFEVAHSMFAQQIVLD